MSTAERTVPTAAGMEAEHVVPVARTWVRRARFRYVVLVATGADFLAVLVAQCAALALTANLFTDQRDDEASLFAGVLVLSAFWLGLLALYGAYRRRRVRISARLSISLASTGSPGCSRPNDSCARRRSSSVSPV